MERRPRGPYKLVRPADDRAWELYDLRADVGEKKDLAAHRPELVEELAKDFSEWHEAARAD